MAVFRPSHDDSELPREQSILYEQDGDEEEEELCECCAVCREFSQIINSASSTIEKKKSKKKKKTSKKIKRKSIKSKTKRSHNGDIISRCSCFPSFDNLPTDYDLDSFFYKEMFFCGIALRARNWVFLGEITNNSTSLMSFFRNRVLVKDRKGETNIPVCFYPTKGTFSYETLKLGHTIAVLLAEQHCFLDLTIGLRIENLNSIKVIPCSLNELKALSKHHASSTTNKCWGCGQIVASHKSLKKCGACKTGRYCNETCQREDWTKRHKEWCKVIPDLLFLSSIDYRNPDKIKYWR